MYDEILGEMLSTYKEKVGFEPDSASDVGIRLRVLATQLDKQYDNVSQLALQVFPQSSTGEYLDMHAEIRGIRRKEAVHAQGELIFSRETGATSDLTVPEGTICATRSQPQIQFITVEDTTMATGQKQVSVAAKAVASGIAGNVAAGAVSTMVSLAPGFTAVKNPADFTNGADEESDSALKERLLEDYRNISNGTNSAFYYNTAMRHEGVQSVSVIPRQRGRGTVDVVFHDNGAIPYQTVLDQLQEQFDRSKEVNVDVLVLAAKFLTVTINMRIEVADGYQFSDVQAACSKRIREYIEALGVGQSLILARFTGEIMAIEGVDNVRIQDPFNDTHPYADEKIALGGFTITRI